MVIFFSVVSLISRLSCAFQVGICLFSIHFQFIVFIFELIQVRPFCPTIVWKTNKNKTQTYNENERKTTTTQEKKFNSLTVLCDALEFNRTFSILLFLFRFITLLLSSSIQLHVHMYAHSHQRRKKNYSLEEIENFPTQHTSLFFFLIKDLKTVKMFFFVLFLIVFKSFDKSKTIIFQQ